MFEPVRVEAAKLFHHLHNKVTGTLYVCGNKAAGNKNATEDLNKDRVNRTYKKTAIILMTETIRGKYHEYITSNIKLSPISNSIVHIYDSIEQGANVMPTLAHR